MRVVYVILAFWLFNNNSSETNKVISLGVLACRVRENAMHVAQTTASKAVVLCSNNFIDYFF